MLVSTYSDIDTCKQVTRRAYQPLTPACSSGSLHDFNIALRWQLVTSAASPYQNFAFDVCTSTDPSVRPTCTRDAEPHAFCHLGFVATLRDSALPVSN